MNVDGYNISYKITGDGPDTVVVLQGWGTEHTIYDSMANAINDRFRVVLFDFPGFGGSDEPREGWDVDAYADFFCKFMEALSIKKASLIGHSYGGRVIIKLATRKSVPFVIDKLVLVDSAGILPKRSASQKWKVKKYKVIKKIVDIRLINILFPELVEDWRSRQGSADYRNASPIMRKCMVMAVNEDLTDLLPNIRQETLLVWGDKDTATPIEDGRKMDSLIPESGLVVIEGAGHYSFLEQPVLFRNVLRSFFGADKK